MISAHYYYHRHHHNTSHQIKCFIFSFLFQDNVPHGRFHRGQHGSNSGLQNPHVHILRLFRCRVCFLLYKYICGFNHRYISRIWRTQYPGVGSGQKPGKPCSMKYFLCMAPAQNATDLLKVVDFTCLLQLVNNLGRTCQ